MRKSLERMELLIRATIQPEEAQRVLIDCPGTDLLQQWTNEATVESEKIRLCLLNKNLHIQEKNARRQLAEQYLAELIYLSDLLFAYKKNYLPPLLGDLYDYIIKELEELILLLHIRYPVYFNRFQKIPAIELHRYRIELRAQARILKQIFSGLLEDKKLLVILMTPICQFAGYIRETNHTYSELWYMKNLVKKLTILGTHHKGKDMDTILIEFLILHNFNSAAFIDYLTRDLLEKEKLPKAIFKKSIILAFHLKVLAQMETISGLCLVANRPSVKEETLNWVKEEINFLDYQQNRKDAACSHKNKMQPTQRGLTEMVKPGEKIKTNFSVAEIALVIRCLQETEMVQCLDRRGIIKRTSMNFTSIGTGEKDISCGSLDSKYSAVEQDTIQSLRKKIRNINNFLGGLEQRLT